MADRICYGQAYILGNQLIQDTITFTEDGHAYNGTNIIIEDIWEDLLADSHQYKKSGKKYFYWEYTQTNDEDQDILIKYEAPSPKPGLFDPSGLEELNPDDYNGEYPKYWIEKINEAKKNYEDKTAIQKKEIVFADNKTVNFDNGAIVNNSKYTVKNNDLGFIENLLAMF
jgi:hypothetical protein